MAARTNAQWPAGMALRVLRWANEVSAVLELAAEDEPVGRAVLLRRDPPG